MTRSAAMLEQIRADGLLAADRRVVVMLSGGRDSTCLLHLAAAIAGPQHVTALHVNYGLRDSAETDQRHCEELCDQLGVRLHVRRAGEPSGNVQAWARTVRYQAAGELAATGAERGEPQRQGSDVAAGHTALDQVETIFYRLASSPSHRAILGMNARDGQIVRPLLGFTREDTGAYCAENGLSWVDDETNATGKYVRGRIRNELLPAFRSLHPAAEQNLLALVANLREEHELLDTLVADELRKHAQLTLARLRALHPALARLIVQQLADEVYAQPAPGIARRLPEILALSEHGTAHLDLPHRIRASARNGALSFGPTDTKRRDHPQPDARA